MKPLERVLITAGGTREKIDDVRYVGNFSSGRLGHAIAQVYARKNQAARELNGAHDSVVTLYAPNSTIERFGAIPGVSHEPFESAQDLREKLLGMRAASTVIHSAAVADYTPEVVSGKIKSDSDELVIRMRRNPKILAELRPHFGEEAILVGFKLLSNSNYDELRSAALKQLEENNLDICVANDLQKIGKKVRHVYTIDRAPGVTICGRPIGYWSGPQSGTTADIAEMIYRKIHNRHSNYDLIPDDD